MHSAQSSDQAIAAIAGLLLARGLTIATAESCTGGLIGGAFTSRPGASVWFRGGIIAYDNTAKRNVLNVPEAVLSTYGAVSAECVKAMALGACTIIGADCAIAVSGIAGPDGGTPEKPIGLVFAGIAIPGHLESVRYLFCGDREAIRRQTVTHALADLHRVLATR
jgi:PncC family amidohydrolase